MCYYIARHIDIYKGVYMRNNDKERFCPISGKKCSDNCEWAVISYSMDEDGMDKYIDCSVRIIADTMLKLDFDFVPFDEEGD
jgi:hypothetical protein